MSAPFLMGRLRAPVSPDDHLQGPPDAPVTLVEYGDYECPFCGEAYYVVKDLQARFPEELRFAFRNFPLASIHPHAQDAAFAAEAAALQGSFWPMHDRLYESQDALEPSDLLAHAEALGLHVMQLEEDARSSTVRERVRADFLGGVRSGVNGTPTFFVNGARHEGSYRFDDLADSIAAARDGRPMRSPTI